VQPPTDGPRADLTAEQVAYLLQRTPAMQVDHGLELVDQDLNVVEDLSGWMSGGQVQRNSYAVSHASARLFLSRELDWGASIVRPYYLVTGPTSAAATTLTTARFYLGAYYTEVSDDDLTDSPPTWDVTGHDVVSVLDDAIGDAYSVGKGVACLTRVEQILQARGVTRYIIDRQAAAVVLTTPMVWTLDDNVTWLYVVNQLLAAVGYRGIYSDWNGWLRCEPYVTPALRASEWTMAVDGVSTIIGQAMVRSRDMYDAPNRWVFYRNSGTDDVAPVTGNGRYEYINQLVGDTSVEARGGRIRTKTMGVDVPDQASLIAQAQITIDADIADPTRLNFPTSPFPLPWHFDRLTLLDPRIGSANEVQASQWTLPLDGGDMSWETTVVTTNA
jgi:hypothetical protein